MMQRPLVVLLGVLSNGESVSQELQVVSPQGNLVKNT